MQYDWQPFPSGISSNGKNAADRTYVDPVESIGSPSDPAATSLAVETSAFSLLKGICANLGLPTGTGDADVNDNAKVYGDPLITLGNRADAAAADAGSQSAISLLKGIAANLGLPA